MTLSQKRFLSKINNASTLKFCLFKPEVSSWDSQGRPSFDSSSCSPVLRTTWDVDRPKPIVPSKGPLIQTFIVTQVTWARYEVVLNVKMTEQRGPCVTRWELTIMEPLGSVKIWFVLKSTSSQRLLTMVTVVHLLDNPKSSLRLLSHYPTKPIGQKISLLVNFLLSKFETNIRVNDLSKKAS